MSANENARTVTVISGKGGTGKTSIAAAFAVLARPVVVADCDVDAANLHLLLAPRAEQETEFMAMPIPEIDRERCTSCGECHRLCPYDAIRVTGEDPPIFEVDPLSCEACMVCKEFCPEKAIDEKDRLAGHWYVGESKVGPMVYAHLGIAAENSGKLVTEVRKAASEVARKNNSRFILVDGPPGIGCAVIASLTNADMVVAVTEATQSGLSDLKRVHDLASHFGIPLNLIINKADLNAEVTESIREWARGAKVKIVGELPYHPAFTLAMVKGETIVEWEEKAGEGAEKITPALKKIWKRVEEDLGA